MKSLLNIIAFISLSIWAFPSLHAQITLSNMAPKVGEEITIDVGTPVDTLVITYRPNSSVVKTDYVVNNTPGTQFTWASKSAGIVNLSYTDRTGGSPTTVSQGVSVRFNGLSAPGLIVMLLAGVILFGGATLAFRTLFRDAEEDGTLDLDPDKFADT